MKMKEYKALRGHYNGKDEITITVPENVKFTYNDGDSGSMCHKGHNHYISFIRLSDYDFDIRKELTNLNRWLHTYKFGDELILLTLNDILFIDDVPLYNSYKEMMDEFELDKYYVIQSKKEKLDEDKFVELYNRKPSILDWFKTDLDYCMIKGKTFQISKIIAIRGPYSVKMFSIANGNYFDDRPTYSMMLHDGIEITNVIQDLTCNSNIKITKDAVDLFEEMKNNVLNQIM